MNIKMIAITGDWKSEYYSSICLEKWAELGYEVEWFEATTPATLGTELDFRETKFNGNRYTEFEKAIWYSHFYLWQSITEPTYIIEHDTYPLKKLPEFDEVGMFSLFPRNNQAWLRGRTEISPGSGYYITKQVAEHLIETALAEPIYENVDGHIFRILNPYIGQHLDRTLEADIAINNYWCEHASCFQIVNYEVGTSAEHNV